MQGSDIGDINIFQNFLKNAPFIAKNVAPDANGKLSFKANLSKYSSLIVVAVDKVLRVGGSHRRIKNRTHALGQCD